MNVAENLPEYATNHSKAIDSAFEIYIAAVENLAATNFVEVVLPILQRRNWVLMQIQGDWRFGPGDDEDQLLHGNVGWSSIYDGDGSDNDVVVLVELLTSEIPGMPNGDLGTWMPSYGFPDCIVEYQP
jgi:hypothetical protein